MAKKYRFSKERFFQIPIQDLIQNKIFEGPLFIYLPKNDHIMLVKHEHAALSESVVKALIEKKSDCFFYRDGTAS